MLWRWIWFRYAAYGVARAAGVARHWLFSGWRPHVLDLAAVSGAGASLWLVGSGPHTSVRELITWTFAVEVAVVYALLSLIVHAYRNRRRLVVLATINHAGEDFDTFAAGLPSQLANDMGRLSKLYKTIDEANPPTQSSKVPELTVGVDDPGGALANVIGENSNVKLGPLDVPLRPLAAVFERSIPGRRLSSSLHLAGNRLTLLADMPGAEGGNWRVERDLRAPASAGATAAKLSEMKEELVYRVFTTIVPIGSEDWDAAKWFMKGLHAFRRTLLTDMNRQINLRDAENHFFTALGHDKYFARCNYNLGFVYRERRNLKAACAAFERAITYNPANADAAYALSLIHLNAGRPEQALEFAEQAITHAPRDMRAWTMKGYVWRKVHAEPESESAWRSSLEFRERAAALAWRDLCRAAWRGQPLDGPRKAIVIPFTNLAVAHLYINNFKRGVRILRQAIWQETNASLYFELGKGLREQGKTSRAVLFRALEAHKRALQFAPTGTDRARYYAYIAETSAHITTFKFERTLVKFDRFLPEYIRRRIGTAHRTALQACEKALGSPSITDEETRSKLSEACQILHEVDRCRVIARIGKALEAIKAVPSETNAQQLERIRQTRNGALRMPPEVVAIIVWTRSPEMGAIAWTQAVFDITLGDLLMQDQQIPRSEDLLRKSVSRLEEHFPEEDQLASANERLAEALRLQSKYIDALAFAEKAVALNPFSPGTIRQLGLAHFNLANYDQAEQELRRSFALDPSDAVTVQFIGDTFWKRGAALTNREDRRSEFQNVIETFDQAMDLAKNNSDRGFLDFWLGRFHGELKEYDSSAQHYEMAKALKAYPVECFLYLGWEDIEQELYDRAESHLRDALQEIFQSRRNAREHDKQDKPSEVKVPPGYWVRIEQDLHDQAERHSRGALWQIFELRQAARDQDKPSGKGPKSPADWWRTPLEDFSDKIPPGFFLLNICLLMALVFTERGRDIKRAKRWLGFVDRHMHFLGEPPPLAERDERVRYGDRRREIAARYKDYLGWAYHLDGNPKQAREHIEASVKMREDEESLCHLARVYLDGGEKDRALDCCDRARTVDMRGVFSPRIARIKSEASRSR